MLQVTREFETAIGIQPIILRRREQGLIASEMFGQLFN
ncbi:MAG: hypothetical protein ACI9WC_002262 [Arenicella sp.]|jgi:hypothetical protein